MPNHISSGHHFPEPLSEGQILIFPETVEADLQGRPISPDTASLQAIANNPPEDVSRTVATDAVNGNRDLSPLPNQYEQLSRKPHRLLRALGGAAVGLLAGLGFSLFIGGVKYGMGEQVGTSHSTVFPGNSFGFDGHGIPVMTSVRPGTKEVYEDRAGPTLILGGAAALGFQIGVVSGSNRGPGGIQKAAKRALGHRKQ